MLSLQGINVLKLTTDDLNENYKYHRPDHVTRDHFKRDVIEAIKMHDIVFFGMKVLKSRF